MKPARLLALVLVVGLSATVALAASALGSLTGIEQLRYRTLDWRQTTTTESLRLGEGDRETPIALVLFDEFSVTDSLEGWPYEQPFPRDYLAEVIDAVAGAGARTIGLDVYLQKLYPRLEGDDRLHDAMERAGNIILVGPMAATDSGPVLARPHPYFADVAAGVGAAELPTAFETVRDGALAVRSGNSLAPSFALSLFAHARGLDVDSLLAGARTTGRISLPGLPAGLGAVPEAWWADGAAARGTIVPFPIRFLGPPSSADAAALPGTFPAFASSTVDLAALFTPQFFADKIVIIGSGFHDSDKFRTPFFQMEAPGLPDGARRAYGYMFGAEIHANALQNMLDGEYVRPLSGSARLLLVLLLSFLAAGAVFWRGAQWGGAVTVVSLAALMVVAFWLWAGQAYGPGGSWFGLGPRFLWFPIVVPGLAAVLAYVGSVAYVSVVEGREKRFIKSAFSKYLSPEVVAEIADNPEILQLGGQKRTLSLLFSDLAGFTTVSERMDPQDLLALMNEYLTEMTQIVLDELGYLDKFIGDAVMAFWNAPKDVPDHADRALRTAVLMQRKMDELNERWRQRDPEHETLVVRIGINTGDVIVGNMGGEERFDYSAIGDSVNLAARLEPANKTYDTLIMASEFTLDAARRDAFRYRELDLIAVKGKDHPVQVFELLELAGVTLPAHREEAIRHFESGMEAYKRRDWALAKQYFEAALGADPGDGPAALYLERCSDNIAQPPPADWDFVVRRTSK